MGQKYIRGRLSQNRAKALKFILSEAALFLILLMLQTTVFARWRMFGVTPDLCYAGLILISYFCGKETGAVTGIAVGFAVDALGSVGISILPVCYLICGYVCGYFTRAIVPRRFGAFLAVLGVALPVRAAISLGIVVLSYRQIHLPSLLLKNILPELLVTGLFALAIYWPLKRLCSWMER